MLNLMKNKTHCPNCDFIIDNESESCHSCGWEMDPEPEYDPIMDYADSEEYRENLMNGRRIP